MEGFSLNNGFDNGLQDFSFMVANDGAGLVGTRTDIRNLLREEIGALGDLRHDGFGGGRKVRGGSCRRLFIRIDV